jgi:hypothetical protein
MTLKGEDVTESVFLLESRLHELNQLNLNVVLKGGWACCPAFTKRVIWMSDVIWATGDVTRGDFCHTLEWR